MDDTATTPTPTPATDGTEAPVLRAPMGDCKCPRCKEILAAGGQRNADGVAETPPTAPASQ